MAVIVTAVIAACGSSTSSSSSTSPGASKVTLTIWHNYGTEQNATALQNLATAFEKLHPNVTIKVVSQPADNYFALLQAAAVSKTGPDLAVMWTGLFTLQYKDFLVNLQGQGPGRGPGAHQSRRAQVGQRRVQSRQRSVRDAARRAVLHRVLQQGDLQEGRRHVVPDRLERASRRLQEDQGGRLRAVHLRQRRAASHGNVLSVLRP